MSPGEQHEMLEEAIKGWQHNIPRICKLLPRGEETASFMDKLTTLDRSYDFSTLMRERCGME
jgi:hypothetical protein